MKRRMLFIFIITCALVNCREPQSQSSNNINTSTTDSSSADTLKKINISANQTTTVMKKEDSVYDSSSSCTDLLTLLIKTSSFDTALKKLDYSVRVDQVTNGVVTIELTTKNTERNEDVALSWIELDINKNELRDVTVDPDKPVQLKYDTSLFKKVVAHCKWQ
jgi:hypothetical protein